MGALQSFFRRHDRRQPAACTVKVMAEMEETPPEEREGGGRTELHPAAEAEAAADEAEVLQVMAGFATDTPLAGGAGLCETMADAGAEVGRRDSVKRTAPEAAAEAGGSGLAVTLKVRLRRGASARAQDTSERSTLGCAPPASDQPAAEVAVAVAVLPLQRDDSARTDLHWAAAEGTPEAVRLLLASASASGGGGAARDGLGMTPLARALQARNRDTATLLVVEACPSPAEPAGAADKFGRTLLHLAAYAGYPEVVRHLLDRGFSPGEVDLCGRDALLWAIESGERKVIEEILKEGYRECVDKQGQTALHMAASRGDAEVVAMLLDCGADADRGDSDGRTALMCALRGGYRDAAFLLATWGPTSLHQRDRQARTPLHWAAVRGDAETVCRLLIWDAPINDVDAQGKSAAALAVDHGHEDAALLLVQADGFRVTRDRDGRTPLHGAAAAGWLHVARELLARGADPREGDNDRQSPATLAKRAGHYSLARTIVWHKWFSKKPKH